MTATTGWVDLRQDIVELFSEAQHLMREKCHNHYAKQMRFVTIDRSHWDFERMSPTGPTCSCGYQAHTTQQLRAHVGAAKRRGDMTHAQS